NYLNAQLTRAYIREGTFVTAFYAVLDPAARTLTYSVAGHNQPRLARQGQVTPLDKNGAVPLGIVEGQAYGQSILSLQPGDLLLLYTDGITEAMAPQQGQNRRELFGVDRLDALLVHHREDGAGQCVHRIRAGVAG